MGQGILPLRLPALALAERAMAANPIEKDPMDGPTSIEILARVSAKMGEPDRAMAALQKLLSIPYAGPFGEAPLTPALLRLDQMWRLRMAKAEQFGVVAAEREDAGRFIVNDDETLTAFLYLQTAIRFGA